MDKSREDKIKEFREAFKNLSEKDQRQEADKLYRITHKIPIIVFEDWETGRSLKFPDINNLMEYLWQAKGIRTTRNMLYKTLRGQYTAAYGYKIYYIYEEI